MTTAQTASIIELPSDSTDTNCISPFESLDLQQQAEKIENAIAGFCQNTLDRLVRLGNILNKFLKECIDKLGERKGKAAFEEWLEAGRFGATKYVAKAAMEISRCFSELSDEWKEVARKNVNTWSVGALKALAKAAKCSVMLLQALVKREGHITEKLITNVTNLVEGRKPNFSRGEFVEIAIDDARQLQGKLGKVTDKDEYGNIIVSPLDGGLEVKLQKQDLVKKTPKTITEPLLDTIEQLRESNDLLREEYAQKDQELSELKLAIASSLTNESLSEKEHDINVVETITKYQQEHPALPDQTQAAELADARTKIENLTQTIEELLRQVGEKERLTQIIENLQHQLQQQKIEALQLREQVQSQQQSTHSREDFFEAQATYLHEAATEEKPIPGGVELLSDPTKNSDILSTPPADAKNKGEPSTPHLTDVRADAKKKEEGLNNTVDCVVSKDNLNGPSPRESSGGERATLNTTINCEVPIDNSFRVALSPPAANCDPFFFRQHSTPTNDLKQGSPLFFRQDSVHLFPPLVRCLDTNLNEGLDKMSGFIVTHACQINGTGEIEQERQELNPYKVAFAAFVNLDLPTVDKEYNSKSSLDLIATLEAVSEQKKTVMPSLSPDEFNEIQFQALAIQAEALKAEIIELTETQQEKVRRIREMEMFESDQKARKEVRTVVKKLADSNLYKDQIASRHRGFAKFSRPDEKR